MSTTILTNRAYNHELF